MNEYTIRVDTYITGHQIIGPMLVTFRKQIINAHFSCIVILVLT